MISRHWKGIAKPKEAKDYMKHLRTDTFPKLSEMSGFISANILKRAVGQGTEFLIMFKSCPDHYNGVHTVPTLTLASGKHF